MSKTSWNWTEKSLLHFYSFPKWIKFPKLLLSTFLPNQEKCISSGIKKILIILPRPFKSAYVTIRVFMLSLYSLQLFATPRTVAHQALLSMGVSRQEYWTGLPCPSPGNLPNPGIEPASLTSSVLADRFFTTRAPGKHFCNNSTIYNLAATGWDDFELK